MSILPQPQQQAVEWDDNRPVWVHPCTTGTERITLPLGANRWQAERVADTVTPSLSCSTCGTHGWWTGGMWFGTNNAPPTSTERNTQP